MQQAKDYNAGGTAAELLPDFASDQTGYYWDKLVDPVVQDYLVEPYEKHVQQPYDEKMYQLGQELDIWETWLQSGGPMGSPGY
jgi:hypothetical protein